MNIKKALILLAKKANLDQELTYQVTQEIINGTATQAQIGAFLLGLSFKGETIEEISGLATAMQEAATQVIFDFPVVDTCGNGGDVKNTFNISTCSAFVVAGCDIKVAKHGNRSNSSASGSADVLEELGININLAPDDVKKCVEEIGIGFFFAPNFHPAMRNVIGPRKELGIRTVFNILGPLISPAGAKHQIIGTPDKNLAEKLIKVVEKLGSEHVFVITGEDGMDEISICSPTLVYEYNRLHNETRKFTIKPEDFGFKSAILSEIQCSSRQESADIIKGILEGKILDAKKDIVILNSAAAILAANKTDSWKEAIKLAQKSIESGNALEKLNNLKKFKN